MKMIRTIESYVREIEKTIGNGKTVWLDEVYTKKLRNILLEILNREQERRATLYEAVETTVDGEWKFIPKSNDRLWFVLNFLISENSEDEESRKIRVIAFLNGETVCTNLAAYKLVRE